MLAAGSVPTCVCVGLKLPGKHGLASLVTRLPFTSGSPDLTIILERKQGLQSYLQVCVCVRVRVCG